MSSAWAGGTDAIIERMEQMTTLFIEEARKSIYTGESAINCEECGEPIPESRRKAIACKYCLSCQTEMERKLR
jgi:phage/conjugal plasmid C-4 type zinc finger TraR family protein